MRKQLRVADIANGRAFNYHVSIVGIEPWHVNNATISVTYSDGETLIADLHNLADARCLSDKLTNTCMNTVLLIK